MIQDTCRELDLPVPTSVQSNQGKEVQRLLTLANRTLKDMRMSWDWVQLQKQGVITLGEDQEYYDLPGDFERFIADTAWDGTNHWMLLGPQNPQVWQSYKNGVVTTTPRKLFRIKGQRGLFSPEQIEVGKQIWIHPIPSAGDQDAELTFEYQSKTCVLPREWVEETNFAVGDYCNYLGNVYKNTSGTTTGSSPPVHTSGSVSDGGITWLYVSFYSNFIADTDISILSEQTINLGIQWRFLRAKGFDFEDRRAEFFDACKKEVVAVAGSKTISMSGNFYGPWGIGPWSVPDHFDI